MRYTEKKGVKRTIASMLKSRSMSITAHSASPLGYLIGISNQMFKAEMIFTLLKKGKEEGIRGGILRE